MSTHQLRRQLIASREALGLSTTRVVSCAHLAGQAQEELAELRTKYSDLREANDELRRDLRSARHELASDRSAEHGSELDAGDGDAVAAIAAGGSSSSSSSHLEAALEEARAAAERERGLRIAAEDARDAAIAACAAAEEAARGDAVASSAAAEADREAAVDEARRAAAEEARAYLDATMAATSERARDALHRCRGRLDDVQAEMEARARASASTYGMLVSIVAEVQHASASLVAGTPEEGGQRLVRLVDVLQAALNDAASDALAAGGPAAGGDVRAASLSMPPSPHDLPPARAVAPAPPTPLDRARAAHAAAPSAPPPPPSTPRAGLHTRSPPAGGGSRRAGNPPPAPASRGACAPSSSHGSVMASPTAGAARFGSSHAAAPSATQEMRRMTRDLKEARASEVTATTQLQRAQALLHQYQQTILAMQHTQAERDAVQAEQLRAAVETSAAPQPVQPVQPPTRPPPPPPPPPAATPSRTGASASSRLVRGGSARQRPRNTDHPRDAKRGWTTPPRSSAAAVAPAEYAADGYAHHSEGRFPQGVTTVRVHQPPLPPPPFGSADDGWWASSELELFEEEMRALHADIDATATQLVDHGWAS